MDRVEVDDVVHAITQVQEFYGKELDKLGAKLWIRALHGRTAEEIKRALADYTGIGKHAPKPVHIIELIEKTRSENRGKLPAPDPEVTHCPPDIARAWMWFINVKTRGSKNLDGMFSKSAEVDAKTQDRYLTLVNHEARRHNRPDAIPDEYKLPEVWQ